MVIGVSVIAVLAPRVTVARSKGLVASGAVPVKLADGFRFTEGPAVDRDGNVWFTDQPDDKVWIWDADRREMRQFVGETGRANGLYFDGEGNLIAASEELNEIRRIASDGTFRVLARRFEGGEFNGPNDVWVAPRSGDIYFTDPLYPREWWRHRGQESELEGEHVYRIAASTGAVTRVIGDLEKPNGIVGTPDGRMLYVSDIGAGRTWVYDVAADGTLTDKRLFVEMGSDGMTIDDRGNIYLTGHGVTVFDRRGTKIEHIDIPSDWTANVVFGGKDRKTLFVTATGGLYAVKMNVRGVK